MNSDNCDTLKKEMMIVTLAWTVMMLENEHLVQNSFPQALQFWDQKVKCTNL